MMRCEEFRPLLQLYVDSELAPREEIEVEAHLLECESCRAEYDSLRSIVDTVRGSKPLYEPPSTLRPKIEATVRGAAEKPRRPAWLSVPAAVAAGLVILLFGFPTTSRGVSFEAFASDAHLGYASGRLPLDIASDNQRHVSSWLKTRMPFHLEVPDSPPDSSEPKAYTLAGARLMQYGNADVAYLAYTMKGSPVSLLVSSSGAIKPSGQQALRSGTLLFHFSTHKGLKVITWRDRDLVYALVSDFQGGDAESCVVCHDSDAERSRFEPMSWRHGAK